MDSRIQKGLYIGIPVVCILIGIGAGWYAKPAVVKTEIKEKIVYQKAEDTKTKTDTKTDTNTDIKTNVVVHKEKVTTKTPDGTVTTKETEDVHHEADKKQVEVQVKTVYVDRVVTETKVETKEVKITPVLPQYHLGVLAGVAPRFDAPLSSAIVVGVEAERRLFGPVWGGVWVMGGSPVQAFNVTNVAGGLKLSMEF